MPISFEDLRSSMVADQLVNRGIRDRRVLDAMNRVPRHLFVPAEAVPLAYADRALPIGNGQTISQPYMVAVMSQSLALRGGERVLEIGTGSGYQAAILAELAGEVTTIERHPELAEAARERLALLGYDNVRVVVGDGTAGDVAVPYDAILVTAGAPRVPESLKAQLADGGRLVIPVGSYGHQELTVVVRRGEALVESVHESCVFVPLVGQQAWPDS